MKLLTKKLRESLPPIYSQDNAADPVARIKFFTPDSNWTWYVIEGQPEGNDVRFFGLVQGFEEELGYFMLSELEAARGPLGMKIERDLHFDPTPISQLRR